MWYLHTVLGAAWTYLASTAACTIATKLWLQRRLQRIDRPEDFDTEAVYAALVVPTLLLVGWIVSSVGHLGGGWGCVCCHTMAGPAADWQHALFVAGGLVPFLTIGWSAIRRWRSRHGRHARDMGREARQRVVGLMEESASLAEHADRVEVVDCDERICAVRGLVSPTIEIDRSLVDKLGDDALRAALQHEVVHLERRDPARRWGAAFARLLNPFSKLLEAEFAAWRFAREVRCDRRVIRRGRSRAPVDLAEALVTVARAHSQVEAGACRLGGDDGEALSARIRLILSTSADGGEAPAGDWSGAFAAAFVASLVVPHLAGPRLLELHCLVEWVLQ